MRRFLIHIAVALVAFTIGLTAASIFGSVFGTRTEKHFERSVYVAPVHTGRHSCPSMRFESMPAPPMPPVAPVAPVAPVTPKTPK